MLPFRTVICLGRRVLLPSTAVLYPYTSVLTTNSVNKSTNNDVPRRWFRKDLPEAPEGTVFKGEDFYGNKYYEAPRGGHQGTYWKTRRWMEPAIEVSEEEYDDLGLHEQMEVIVKRQETAVMEVPPEWESWMRGRRPQTPSLQEQARSARVALKAKGLFTEKETQTPAAVHSSGKTAEEIRKDSVTGLSFPVYEDLEVTPGEELSPAERKRRIARSKVDEGDHREGTEYVPPGAKRD